MWKRRRGKTKCLKRSKRSALNQSSRRGLWHYLSWIPGRTRVDSAMNWAQWRRGYWKEAQALLSSCRWKSHVREES